jgi:methionine synthase I (cobalamin-dependent)
VILCFTLRNGGRVETLAGELFVEVVLRTADSGADVVGVNCVEFDMVQQAVDQINRVSELPVAASPNAGTPEGVAGGLRYPEAETELAHKVTN